MATAKVISHSFKTKEGEKGVEQVVSPTLILAKAGDKEVRVSIPVTRQGKPAVGAEIEITEPVKQVKPVFNANGIPVEPVIIYSANLLTKSGAALVKREAPAKQAAAK